jgi:hypothetical protein
MKAVISMTAAWQKTVELMACPHKPGILVACPQKLKMSLEMVDRQQVND